ncbi:MAG TPA: TolC family protein, partial [Leptospiraceae bacterium]|nr:TolC family protein [Leptospiraceae bacterium]
MKKGLLIFILSSMMISLQLSAEKKTLTVDEIIRRLDQTDPEIAASRFRVIAARKTAEKSNSAYYPKIELQGLVPVPGGLPGSYGEIGVRGVMISPFHTGNSIGFLGTYTLFDFGRTKNAVKAAEQDELTKKEEARIARINTIQNTLHIYYDC